MPIIKILPHESLCPEGKTFEVPVGAQLCEAILKNDIALEHACEMSCACTTCHAAVLALPAWLRALPCLLIMEVM